MYKQKDIRQYCKRHRRNYCKAKTSWEIGVYGLFVPWGKNMCAVKNMPRILRYRLKQVDRLRKYAEIGTVKVLYRGLV